MGTRADFYVGRGKDAEWLGSIAWDGYPTGIAGKKHGTADGNLSESEILTASTESAFRDAVAVELDSRDDATKPEDGWPWPWETSHTTDYAYAFDAGRVWASCFGHPWFDPLKEEPEHDDNKPTVFPDMTERKRMAPVGSNRSGVMLFTSRRT